MQYDCNTFEINAVLFDRVGRVCYIVYSYLIVLLPVIRSGGTVAAWRPPLQAISVAAAFAPPR